MPSPKNILLETLKKDGKPSRQLVQFEAFDFIQGIPVRPYLCPGRVPGAVFKDLWGITFQWPPQDRGPMPVFENGLKAIKDITRWREEITVPSLDVDLDWSEAQAYAAKVDRDRYFAAALFPMGIFEQLHHLMSFEDTFINLYDEPEAMHDLIDAILEHKMEYARLLIEKCNVEAIFSFDDWGSSRSLFISPEMWREFFKEPYRKLYSYIKAQGVLLVHHADSYLVPIVKDMVEIGVDIWQGILPENDVAAVQDLLDGEMTVMGGIGAAIDRVDATEEEIRAYVRNVCETYGPRGHFIPCITYGTGGTLYPHIEAIIDDEIRRYNVSQAGL
ncbi:MAG: uroporphyrinogen decarboxylase (URO-D) [Clostridiales bacterium]|nr:uroporphyrinogen decarboxylase (URO-D) [Clostridiales bacterium]